MNGCSTHETNASKGVVPEHDASAGNTTNRRESKFVVGEIEGAEQSRSSIHLTILPVIRRVTCYVLSR